MGNGTKFRARYEGGHLAPGDETFGAVTGRTGGAPGGDPGGGEGVDVVGVGMARGVGEAGRGLGLQIEGSGEEGRHLAPGDRSVGAVPGRTGGAPEGYVELRQTFHIRRPPHLLVHIGEAGGRSRRSFVQRPDEPHRHDPALEGLARTDETLPALGALQDALRGQGVDGRLVDGAVIVVEPPKRHGSGDEQRRSSQG